VNASALATIRNSLTFRVAAIARPRTVDLQGRAGFLFNHIVSRTPIRDDWVQSIASESCNENKIARYLLYGRNEADPATTVRYKFNCSFRKFIVDPAIKRSSC